MPEQFLFTKEKGSLFNVKVWMKLLVKKNTPCYGSGNRNKKEIGWNFLYMEKSMESWQKEMKES